MQIRCMQKKSVQSDKLLLGDVFENFRNICFKIYKLNSTKFISVYGLAWQAALKKTKVKLDLLTYIDILLMVEKVSEEVTQWHISLC